jgi:hypothetical protein
MKYHLNIRSTYDGGRIRTLVYDLDGGGAWTPSDDAQDAIDASPDPAGEAIRIATDEPMRGTWAT